MDWDHEFVSKERIGRARYNVKLEYENSAIITHGSGRVINIEWQICWYISKCIPKYSNETRLSQNDIWKTRIHCTLHDSVKIFSVKNAVLYIHWYVWYIFTMKIGGSRFTGWDVIVKTFDSHSLPWPFSSMILAWWWYQWSLGNINLNPAPFPVMNLALFSNQELCE